VTHEKICVEKPASTMNKHRFDLRYYDEEQADISNTQPIYALA